MLPDQLPDQPPHAPAALPAGRAHLQPPPAAFGLLSLGGVQVALPLAALREVVARPARLAPMPVVAPGLLGVMELRTLLVPVLDLRPCIGVACDQGAPGDRDTRGDAQEAGGQVVVVLVDEGQVLGLLADAVHGILRVGADDLLPVRTHGAPLLLSHAFRDAERGTVVNVLDPAAVLRLPGVPTVAAPSLAHGQPPRGQAARSLAGEGRKLTLLRCGSYVFALDVAHVHTTIPAGTEHPFVVQNALCRGVTSYAGREVAVVDLLSLLGLGRLRDDEVGVGLVLALERGYVVLALTELLDIVEVPDGAVLPLPAFATARPDLLGGVTVGETAGQCLVLSGDALVTEPELVALSALNTDDAQARPAAADPLAALAPGDGGVRPAYLTYRAGADIASPLSDIAEILPVPTTHTRTGSDGALLGVLVHRDAAVPVLDLAGVLGLPTVPVTPAACLLLVHVDDDRVAFFVEGLRAIDTLSWQDPDAARRGADGGLSSCPLVQVGADGRLVPGLDLVAVARGLSSGRPGPGAARSPAPALPAPRSPVALPAAPPAVPARG